MASSRKIRATKAAMTRKRKRRSVSESEEEAESSDTGAFSSSTNEFVSVSPLAKPRQGKRPVQGQDLEPELSEPELSPLTDLSSSEDELIPASPLELKARRSKRLKPRPNESESGLARSSGQMRRSDYVPSTSTRRLAPTPPPPPRPFGPVQGVSAEALESSESVRWLPASHYIPLLDPTRRVIFHTAQSACLDLDTCFMIASILVHVSNVIELPGGSSAYPMDHPEPAARRLIDQFKEGLPLLDRLIPIWIRFKSGTKPGFAVSQMRILRGIFCSPIFNSAEQSATWTALSKIIRFAEDNWLRRYTPSSYLGTRCGRLVLEEVRAWANENLMFDDDDMDHLQTAWIQHLGSSPCAQRLVERAHLLITRHHQLQQFAKTHVLSVKEGNRTLRASASHHAIVVNDTAHVFVPEFPPKHMNKILADLDMVQPRDNQEYRTLCYSNSRNRVLTTTTISRETRLLTLSLAVQKLNAKVDLPRPVNAATRVNFGGALGFSNGAVFSDGGSQGVRVLKGLAFLTDVPRAMEGEELSFKLFGGAPSTNISRAEYAARQVETYRRILKTPDLSENDRKVMQDDLKRAVAISGHMDHLKTVIDCMHTLVKDSPLWTATEAEFSLLDQEQEPVCVLANRPKETDDNASSTSDTEEDTPSILASNASSDAIPQTMRKDLWKVIGDLAKATRKADGQSDERPKDAGPIPKGHSRTMGETSKTLDPDFHSPENVSAVVEELQELVKVITTASGETLDQLRELFCFVKDVIDKDNQPYTTIAHVGHKALTQSIKMIFKDIAGEIGRSFPALSGCITHQRFLVQLKRIIILCATGREPGVIMYLGFVYISWFKKAYFQATPDEDLVNAAGRGEILGAVERLFASASESIWYCYNKNSLEFPVPFSAAAKNRRFWRGLLEITPICWHPLCDRALVLDEGGFKSGEHYRQLATHSNISRICPSIRDSPKLQELFKSVKEVLPCPWVYCSLGYHSALRNMFIVRGRTGHEDCKDKRGKPWTHPMFSDSFYLQCSPDFDVVEAA